jgi:hypothetical protein
MSSRPSHRLAICALVLAVLLALAAPPAQAGTRSSLLGNLGAGVQTWLTAWWPGAGLQDPGTTDANGRANVKGSSQLPAGPLAGSPASHRERSGHRLIKPVCTPIGDPNGCPH